MSGTAAGALSEFASGLQFPEGPVALDDGSLLVVEIARGTLTRISKTGALQVIADLGGGPNGAALGPDGRCYVCNNGGISFHAVNGQLRPGFPPPNYCGGWIEAVDLTTGKAERLYDACDGNKLTAPNDIVFDARGGFWFTDLGKQHRGERKRDQGAVFYAEPDGSSIRQAIFPLEGPNGIGLSAGEDMLFVSESTTGRLWSFEIETPGRLKRYSGQPPWKRGRLHWAAGYYAMLDSLCLDEEGFVYVGDIPHGGVSVISPDGKLDRQIETGDELTTNICFGGPRRSTMFMTLSSTGKVACAEGRRRGLRLPWSA